MGAGGSISKNEFEGTKQQTLVQGHTEAPGRSSGAWHQQTRSQKEPHVRNLPPARIWGRIQAPPSYGSGRYGFGVFGPRTPFCVTGGLWGRVTPVSRSLF